MSAVDVIGILSFALHVTHKVYDAVQEVRKAPEEIKALQDEVRFVRELLERIGIRASDEESGGDGASQAESRQLVQLSGKGGELITAANKFIERSTLLGEDGVRKVKKMRWLFKSSKVKELTEDFKAFHRALTDVCSISTYVTARSMGSKLSALEQTVISAVDERITRAVKHEITPAMEQLLDEERIAQILVRSLAIVAQQQREGRHQLFDELSTLHGNHEDRHRHPPRRLSQSLMHESTDLCEHGSSSIPTDSRVEPRQTGSSSCLTDTAPSSQPLPSLHPRLGPLRQHCPSDCRCRCHKQSSTYRLIPRALRSWFGDVRIHEGLLTSLVSSTRPCDDARCMQTRESLSIIKWYLPTLFGRVSAEIEFQSFPVHFVIQTPRVIASLGFLYDLSFEELKIKLSTREVTVHDIDPFGFSLLHRIAYRVVTGSDEAHDMMRYLVDAGAPRDWEYRGLTVTEYVVDSSTRWLGNGTLATSALKSFEHNIGRPLLEDDMEDAWERIRTKRTWSDLHYLLAKPPSSPIQLKTKLTAILNQPDAALHVNNSDSFGRTPLLQAIRTCPAAVDPLLRASANPYFLDASLVDAVRALSCNAVSPLVRAGADVNEPCYWSDGEISIALHDVPRWWSLLGSGPSRRLPVALELMRHAGHLVDWGAEDEFGWNPLDWAERLVKKNPRVKEVASIYELYRTQKLPCGAQLADKSRLDEETEIVLNIESMSLIKMGLAGNARAIGPLIDAGAMVNERDNAGRTLLHLVAMGLVPNGYVIALELMRYGGYGVDWDALTVDEETAEDLANESFRLVSLGNEGRQKEPLAIVDLLRHRVLPDGMEYIYPCMYPEYCWECCALPCSGYCSSGLRMPGQWY